MSAVDELMAVAGSIFETESLGCQCEDKIHDSDCLRYRLGRALAAYREANTSGTAVESAKELRSRLGFIDTATGEFVPDGGPERDLPTAREVAHGWYEGWLKLVNTWWCDKWKPGQSKEDSEHDGHCNIIVAGIEARDEAWNRNINQNDRDWEAKREGDATEIMRLQDELSEERGRLSEAMELLQEADPFVKKLDYIEDWLRRVRAFLAAPKAGTP